MSDGPSDCAYAAQKRALMFIAELKEQQPELVHTTSINIPINGWYAIMYEEWLTYIVEVIKDRKLFKRYVVRPHREPFEIPIGKEDWQVGYYRHFPLPEKMDTRIDLVLPVRIGLSGKLRSGKDTLAQYLVEKHGFTRFAFADRLKELAVEMFGMSNKKNRALLITLSARLLSIDRMCFVNYVLNRIPLWGDVVVSDVRYPHEYHALKMLGFKMVRIEVSREEQIRRIQATESELNPEVLDDPSEIALDQGFDWDTVIGPDRTLTQMFERIALDVNRWRGT